MKIASQEFKNQEEYYQTIIIALLLQLRKRAVNEAVMAPVDLQEASRYVVQVDHEQKQTTLKLVSANELDKQHAREYFDRKKPVKITIQETTWQNP